MKNFVICCAVIAASLIPQTAVAQTAPPNFQFTNKAVDFGDRGELKVNPSTLGLEIQIPLGSYPGRTGMSLPVTLSYSSALWRMDYNFYIPGQYTSNGDNLGNGYTGVVAQYAEHSMSGWTSSLGFPFLDGTPTPYYDINGQPKPPGTNTCGTSGCYLVDRQIIWMPDGSSHEFRSTDQPKAVSDTTPFPDDMYAVDGSRMRYQKSTQTLFMPDGSRYLLAAHQYVDRNGNTLTYESGNSRWLDTLGRAIPLPPVSMPDKNVKPSILPNTYTYSLPGVNGTPVNYTFVWKNLGDPNVLTTAQPLQYIADSGCPPGNGTNSPRLFQSDAFSSTCIINANSTFNPVVLYQIVLPTGQAYTFTYDIYGEIDKVQFPTGGYERYQYQQGTTVTYTVPPYSQAFRHVTNRYVSPSGTGTNEAQWQYGNGVTTAPDNSQVGRSQYGEATTDSWGYSPDSARAGMSPEECSYSAPDPNAGDARHMLRRHLTEWTMTGSNAVGLIGVSVATRNARVTKEVDILLDTGGGPALAKTTTYGYDTTYQFSVGVEQTSKNEYDYVAVDQTSAQTAAIGSIPAGTLLRTTQTSYLTGDSGYRLLNILGLPSSITVQDGAGVVAAKTMTKYDESAYQLVNNYGQVTNWSDPGAVRGNPTTVRHFIDATASAPFGQSCPAGVCLDTHTKYDQAGSPVESVDAKGNVAQVAYSSTYAYAYPTGTTSPVPDPTGTFGSNIALTTGATYDLNTGLVTSTTDANGQQTTYEYSDPLDRLTAVNLPDGGRTTHTYVNAHQCGPNVETRTLLDASGRVIDSFQYFDGLGRPYLSQTYENQDTGNPWLSVDTQYDSMGRAFKVSSPYRSPGCTSTPNPSGWTQTTFDDLSRPTQVLTTADGAAVTISYSGNTVTATDQAGRQRSSVSDALGRPYQVIEDPSGLNYLTVYAYDALSNLRTVTQGQAAQVQQTRSFAYDSLSRLTSATNPENGTVRYTYDENANLKTKTDARNIAITYAYDALNRIEQRTYSDSTPTVTYVYDTATNGKGRLASVSSSMSTYSYSAYDSLGRVTSSTQTTDGVAYPISYSYNLAGGLASEQYPSGKVVLTEYDSAGRVAGVRNQGAASYYAGGAPTDAGNRIQYTPHGAVSAMRLGNGLWEHASFNARLQLTQIGLGTSATDASVLKLDYSYGLLVNGSLDPTKNNGNVQGQTITLPGLAVTQAYSYDSLNRITLARETKVNDGTETWKQGYTYLDANNQNGQFGNRRIDTGNTTANVMPAQNPTINPANNRFDAGQGYGYDAAGNLTAEPQHAYEYDAGGRMTANDRGGDPNVATVYGYDGEGRRVKKATANGATTVFAYDAAGQLVAEYSTQATSSGTSYLTQDQLGSTRIATDSAGNPTSRHDYLPFGEEIKSSVGGRDTVAAPGYNPGGVLQKFTSKERDNETGLDYFGVRYYSSSLGRFTGTDPSRRSVKLANPQSQNRYSYSLNNPLRYIDSNGEWPTAVHEWIIDHALPKLSVHERGVIKKASKSVDYAPGAMSNNNAYQHGLRRSDQSVQEAAEASDKWINDHINGARKTSSNDDDSLTQFGMAYHTVSDETSPSHIGYQIWRGLIDDGALIALPSWGKHYFQEMESIGFDFFHMGFAIAVTQRLYAETYGEDCLREATGGIEFGSEQDPTMAEIEQYFHNNRSFFGFSDLAGGDSPERQIGEAVYEYRLGLTAGNIFDYHRQSNLDAVRNLQKKAHSH